MAVNPAEMDLVAQINQLEAEIEALKQEYEQYFLGLIRIEPAVHRQQVQRALLKLGGRQINNAGLRFRLQQLRARYNTLQTYWNRVVNQMETGRYVREEKRLELRARQTAKDGAAAPEASRAPAPPGPGAGLDTLYKEFIESRKRCGERVDNVTVDRLAQFINSQETQLKAQYGDRAIDFKVVVEDGRTKLRAILKK